MPDPSVPALLLTSSMHKYLTALQIPPLVAGIWPVLEHDRVSQWTRSEVV